MNLLFNPGGKPEKSVEHGIRRRRSEQRREPRYVAEIESLLFYEGVGEPVIIRNLSSYGALLHGRSFPPINSQVTLITEDREFLATVIWLGPDKCGLLLGAPVEPLTLIRERPIRRVEGHGTAATSTGPVFRYA